LQQIAGALRALGVKHLPAHDLAAEEVHKQVQVEVSAAQLRGQVGECPSSRLYRPAWPPRRVVC
jgi:hypothetical protein